MAVNTWVPKYIDDDTVALGRKRLLTDLDKVFGAIRADYFKHRNIRRPKQRLHKPALEPFPLFLVSGFIENLLHEVRGLQLSGLFSDDFVPRIMYHMGCRQQYCRGNKKRCARGNVAAMTAVSLHADAAGAFRGRDKTFLPTLEAWINTVTTLASAHGNWGGSTL